MIGRPCRHGEIDMNDVDGPVVFAICIVLLNALQHRQGDQIKCEGEWGHKLNRDTELFIYLLTSTSFRSSW